MRKVISLGVGPAPPQAALPVVNGHQEYGMRRPSDVRQPVAPDFTPSGYMPHLDAVRAIAIGFVLVEHFGGRAVNAYIPFGAGSIGVNLFFVLSRFLVTGILLDTFKRNEYGSGRGRKLFNFYIRRVLRMTPVLW